jgi:hypothetical protein
MVMMMIVVVVFVGFGEVIGPEHFGFVQLVFTAACASRRRWREREDIEKSVT